MALEIPSVGGTILGGFIAGGIGFLTTLYSIRKRQGIDEENWRGQARHLTERLQFDYGAADSVHHDTKGEQKRDRRTADLVIPELERHLGKAPVRISESVREEQQELLAVYSRLDMHQVGDIATVTRLKRISQHAENIQAESFLGE